MIELRDGRDVNEFSTASFAELVLSSAPILLPYLFSGQHQAVDYIDKASLRSDGQYSVKRHQLAFSDKQLIGCVSLWHTELERTFYTHTLKSLSDFLSPKQIKHLVVSNHNLEQVFSPPLSHQVCVGHLAVIENFQGLGVGKKMIAFVIQKAKCLGKTELVLDVDKSNDSALCFYLGLGFITVKEIEFGYTEQIFCRMRYSLI